MSIAVALDEVTLRRFTPPDSRPLYAIRNHFTVRRFMSRPQLIPYRQHVQWVQANLLQPTELHLWMVRVPTAPRPIGFTQLRLEGNGAEIGVIFREPRQHALAIGLASFLTVYLAWEKLNLQWLSSYVLPGHQAAIDINSGFGATVVPSDRADMLKMFLPRTRGVSDPRYTRWLARLGPQIRLLERTR